MRTRSVAFGATKLSVNSCLEKMSGVQARTYNVSESTDMTHFCDVAAIVNAFEDGAEDSFRDTHEELWASHPVAGGAMLTPPRKRLHIEDETALNSVLLSNYISLRKLFKKDAVSDPPGYPISRLWDVLRMCHLTKAGSEDVDKKIAQINIAGLDGKGQAPPARSEEEYTKEDFVACLEAYSVPEETVLTPSQWVYVLLLVASDVFSAGVHKRLALHEKFYFLVEKKLFCYLDVCDITEFREVVYHTDVQDVLQEYSVKLRFVFDHYAEKKARMAFNQYVVFLADAGAVLGTDLRAARPGGEQKLSVCYGVLTESRKRLLRFRDRVHSLRSVGAPALIGFSRRTVLCSRTFLLFLLGYQLSEGLLYTAFSDFYLCFVEGFVSPVFVKSCVLHCHFINPWSGTPRTMHETTQMYYLFFVFF